MQDIEKVNIIYGTPILMESEIHPNLPGHSNTLNYDYDNRKI
jgi:hypothetical protein